MNELPTLSYKQTAPQVVPDLNNAESLETLVPIVTWGGKQVHIKEIWSRYHEINTVHEPVQKLELRLCLINIISNIQKTHPDYLRSCLSE